MASSTPVFLDMHSVTAQPMGFQAASLEPNSRNLYHSLRTIHASGETLSRKVDSAGLQLLENVKGRASARGNMQYDEMLGGMIMNGERLLSTDYLDFLSLSIYDEKFNFLQTKPAGKVILTDKRMLLISSQYYENFTLSKFGDPKTLPGGYSMELTCSDSIYYLPLPLRFFRSVEMKNQIGVSGSISLHGQTPPCCGLLKFCGCLKDWLLTPLHYAEVKEIDMTFGVLMPPWQSRSFIRLHLGTHIEFHRVQQMLSLFQSVAPNIL